MEVLTRIVECRLDFAPPDLELRVGLPAGRLRGEDFRASEVRAHAIRSLGESDLPGALEYLENLRPADISPDNSSQTLSSLQIAVRQAQLNRISDEVAKRRFLERTMKERSVAGYWARERLCDRGSQESLSIVREAIRYRYSPSDADREIAFCEARVATLARDSDRATALASALRVEDVSDSGDRDIVTWAVSELEKLNSPLAVAELRRFCFEVDAAIGQTSEDKRRASRLRSLRDLLQRTLGDRFPLPKLPLL